MARRTFPRWMRFSLRTFLLVITLVAIWIGFKCQRAREQANAVAALQKLSVQVIYDWQYRMGRYELPPTSAKPSAPEWLRKAVGEHFFQTVVRIDGNFAQIHDADLKILEQLPEIRYVSLCDTSVTDEGMRYIAALPNVQFVVLAATKVGDAGLKQLTKAKTLRSVTLPITRVTDAGLAALQELPNLERLLLGSTKISDEGVPHLEKLKSLRVLGLQDTKVTEAGIARLTEALPNCRIHF